MSQDYWQEALDCALDEIGCFEILTQEQRSAVAKSLNFASEMKSETTGTYLIPHPAIDEMKRMEVRHNKVLKELNTREELLIAQIAKDHKLRPEQIDVHNGEVEQVPWR